MCSSREGRRQERRRRVVSVRLKHKSSGKPVADAVIIQTRIDMSPDAMGEMASPITAVPQLLVSESLIGFDRKLSAASVRRTWTPFFR